MAKDTEKLIRQLSLISFLMANRRPVSALEIKREVEGYSSMNEDAFARRFYADRAELESLGISLQVEKPAEGFFEAELYALPPENYYLPAIEFSDPELAALAHRARPARRRVRLRGAAAPRAAAGLLGPAEPAHRGGRGADRRQALDRRLGPRALAAPGEDRDRDLAPQDDRVLLLLAAARRRLRPQGEPLPPRLPRGPVLFDRLLARARRGPGSSGSRGSAARSPTRPRPSTTSPRPRTSTARDYARARRLADGRAQGNRAKVFLRERIAWLVERDFGRHGDAAQARARRRRQGPRDDLRDRVRLGAPADLLGALAGARTRACSTRPSSPPRPTSASRCCATATARSSTSRRPSAARSPRARTAAATAARAAPTAAPSR